ncbi:MAG: tetratricopeptide repeat protein, partial [Cyclobacteriaceae bacterium]|nr:tetratricopeptide repeat protein [Cyclobacteriaceae bacterium]
AVDDFSKVIEIDDNFIEAYYQRGKAQQQLMAYEEAIKDCTKVLQLHPKNADAYHLRGLLLLEFGRIDEACKDLSKAGELGDVTVYEVIRERCNKN